MYLDRKIKKEIAIPYSLYQSKKENYFIGETPILTGQYQRALAALKNPTDSNVDVYVNVITVTNISDLNVSAEFYLGSDFDDGIASESVSCTNLAINPPPIPEAKIEYLTIVSQPPKNGKDIFTRVVPPNSTLVIDGGQIIIPPGQSLAVYLGGILPVVPNSTIVAFGWWEEKKFEYCAI